MQHAVSLTKPKNLQFLRGRRKLFSEASIQDLNDAMEISTKIFGRGQSKRSDAELEANSISSSP